MNEKWVKKTFRISSKNKWHLDPIQSQLFVIYLKMLPKNTFLIKYLFNYTYEFENLEQKENHDHDLYFQSFCTH